MYYLSKKSFRSLFCGFLAFAVWAPQTLSAGQLNVCPAPPGDSTKRPLDHINTQFGAALLLNYSSSIKPWGLEYAHGSANYPKSNHPTVLPAISFYVQQDFMKLQSLAQEVGGIKFGNTYTGWTVETWFFVIPTKYNQSTAHPTYLLNAAKAMGVQAPMYRIGREKAADFVFQPMVGRALETQDGILRITGRWAAGPALETLKRVVVSGNQTMPITTVLLGAGARTSLAINFPIKTKRGGLLEKDRYIHCGIDVGLIGHITTEKETYHKVDPNSGSGPAKFKEILDEYNLNMVQGKNKNSSATRYSDRVWRMSGGLSSALTFTF